MARHGDNIRKRKDGRWEGRYPVYSEEKGKNDYRSVYGRTYEEVWEKLYIAKSGQRGGIAGAGAVSPQSYAYQGRLYQGQPCPGGPHQASAYEGQMLQSHWYPGGLHQSLAYGEGVPLNHWSVLYPRSLPQSQPQPHRNPSPQEHSSSEGEKPVLLFSQMAWEWLDQIRSTRKFSTYVKYKQIFENHLENTLLDTELSDVTSKQIKERLPDSMTESMEKSIYCVLNQILGYASRQYSIAVPNLKRPLAGTRNKPVSVLARKEQGKLLAALHQEPDPFRTAISLCLHTGLRLGEVCALKWSDIDFDNRLVTVSRTVQRLAVEGEPTRTLLLELAPKSEYSRREIPLSGPVLELLHLPGDKEYIFGGDRPMDPRTMQYRFKRFLKRAGLPERNFHILRHTFATNCIEGGADVKSLSEILGHSDVKITLNRYVHPSMDTKRKHMDSLSGFYGQIHGQAD